MSDAEGEIWRNERTSSGRREQSPARFEPILVFVSTHRHRQSETGRVKTAEGTGGVDGVEEEVYI